jgi:hypothetical protein
MEEIVCSAVPNVERNAKRKNDCGIESELLIFSVAVLMMELILGWG